MINRLPIQKVSSSQSIGSFQDNSSSRKGMHCCNMLSAFFVIVCMYVCMYVCKMNVLRVCIYVCKYSACMSICQYVLHVRTYVRTYVSMYETKRVSTVCQFVRYVCMNVCMNVQVIQKVFRGYCATKQAREYTRVLREARKFLRVAKMQAWVRRFLAYRDYRRRVLERNGVVLKGALYVCMYVCI